MNGLGEFPHMASLGEYIDNMGIGSSFIASRPMAHCKCAITLNGDLGGICKQAWFFAPGYIYAITITRVVICRFHLGVPSGAYFGRVFCFIFSFLGSVYT